MKKTKALVRSRIEALYETKRFYATDLLRERCEEVGIEPPTFQPMDNNIVCWRLPPLEMTKGKIIIPQDAQSPHIKGILVAMGPRARDVLYSNGIQEGHIVTWARFSGWEIEDKASNRALGDEFIFLKDRDILGSDDLRVELAEGRARYMLDEKTGRYCLQRKLLNGKKEKLLALAASTNSPAEAETARKLAARMQ